MESISDSVTSIGADLGAVAAYSVAVAARSQKQRFVIDNAYTVDVSGQAGFDAVLTTCEDVYGYRALPSQNWLIEEYLASRFGAASKAKVGQSGVINLLTLQDPIYGRIGKGVDPENPTGFGYFETERNADGSPVGRELEDSAVFLVLYGGLKVKIVYKLLLGVAADYTPKLCVGHTMSSATAQGDNLAKIGVRSQILSPHRS